MNNYIYYTGECLLARNTRGFNYMLVHLFLALELGDSSKQERKNESTSSRLVVSKKSNLANFLLCKKTFPCSSFLGVAGQLWLVSILWSYEVGVRHKSSCRSFGNSWAIGLVLSSFSKPFEGWSWNFDGSWWWWSSDILWSSAMDI